MKTKHLMLIIAGASSLFATRAGAVVIQPAPLPGPVSPQWTSINDCTFETRGQFYSGLGQLEATVDRQVRELTARHAAMNMEAKAIDRTDWDLAIKELVNARSYLLATDKEVREATPDTWNQKKDKVSDAWARTQDDCAQAMFTLQE